MIEIEPIDFPGIDGIKNNIEFYKNKFLSDKIIVFKDANCNESMQNEISDIFNVALNCSTIMSEGDKSFYIENHHRHIDKIPNAGKDDILLYWHTEHVGQDRSHAIGVWNMELFTCDRDSGKTYFVDMVDMYNNLTKEEQDFMDKSIIKFSYGDKNINNNEEFIFPMSKEHWITNEKGLRVIFGSKPELTLFDNRTPTEEEVKIYQDLYEKIEHNATQNENIRMVLRWEQGYLAIPDLFKLAHSVTGGFDKEERRLRGLFALENKE